MTDTAQSYGTYGLRLRSAVALPFNRLPDAVDVAAADVTVRFGVVPRALPAATSGPFIRRAFWEAQRDAFLMHYEGVARYLVTNGRDVLVEPWGGSEDDIAAILANTPLTALLQQRGVATLHAAAVQAEAGAVLLLGRSGDGKSSLAAALVERGYPLVADDVAAVVLNGKAPTALPGFATLRLWKQTLDKMRMAHRAGARVRGTLEKFWVPTPRSCSEPLPLSAVFVLTPQSRPDIRIESMPPGDAFAALAEHAHRPRVMDAMGQRPAHFRAAAAIARDVPVMRVTRPVYPFLLEELAARVEARMTAQLPMHGRKVGDKQSSPPAPEGRPATAAPIRPRSGGVGASAPVIVWLSSWPKSGSTWLRAVLTNYLADSDEPASINALVGTRVRGRTEFDECLGIASADMSDDEVARRMPAFREVLAERLFAARSTAEQSRREPVFVKTHDAYRLPNAAPRFPRAGAAGVVYLVRNPLDVAVSYAHHLDWPLARTIAHMNDPDAWESRLTDGIFPQLPEPLGTWSGHVASWTEQTALPVHVARYEDLLADPHGQFGTIVRFTGLEWDGARLARAVEHSAFHRLRAQEAADGFNEKQPTAASFFRAGVAGQWRSVLQAAQVQAVVDAHGEAMERFGYLPEALAGTNPGVRLKP